MQRFERAMAVVVKSPPQHRTKPLKAKRKLRKKNRFRARVFCQQPAKPDLPLVDLQVYWVG